MSLLDGVEDEVYSSDNDEMEFGNHSHIAGRGGNKGKKGERRARGGEEKRALHWTKHKENVVQEKTPKKSKGQNKSISWTPPDSPKLPSRPAEGKGAGQVMRVPVISGVSVGGQLQPSPNIKNQRKRYSQLGTGSSTSSSDEGECGYLVSNQPALQDQLGDRNIDSSSSHVVEHSTNPFLADSNQPFLTDLAPMEPMGVAREPPQQHDWISMMTAMTPTTVASKQQGTGTINPLAFSTDFDPFHCPIPVAFGFEADSFLDAAQPPQLLPHPLPQSQPSEGGEIETNPFLPSSSQPFPPEVNQPLLPEINPLAAAPTDISAAEKVTMQPLLVVPPTATPITAEDWSISEELRAKCLQQFAELHPVNGVLEGNKARQFFIQSKLPHQELSAIW